MDWKKAVNWDPRKDEPYAVLIDHGAIQHYVAGMGVENPREYITGGLVAYARGYITREGLEQCRKDRLTMPPDVLITAIRNACIDIQDEED